MELYNRNEFYLILESRSSKINEKQFYDLLNVHCKEHLKYIDNSKHGFKQIYRGVRGLEDLYAKVDPTSSEERTSAYNANFYNYVVSNSSKWSEYPNRSKSLICSFDFRTANIYGSNKAEDPDARKYDTFAVIPYDGVEIGICPTEDFTTSFTTPYKQSSKTDIQKKYDKRNYYHIGNIINDSIKILTYLKNNSETLVDKEYKSEYEFYEDYSSRFVKLSSQKTLEIMKDLDSWKSEIYNKFGSFNKIKKWILSDHPGTVQKMFSTGELNFPFDWLKNQNITLFDFIDNLLDPSLYGFQHLTYDGDLNDKLRRINQSREVWVGGPSLMIKLYNNELSEDDATDWKTHVQKGKYNLLNKIS